MQQQPELGSRGFTDERMGGDEGHARFYRN
jgi:hypothetical protein